MNNPSIEPNNVITPHQEVELSFAPGRSFKLRKADLMFDSWCQDNYTSVQEFYNMLFTSGQPGADGKKLSFAITRAFYHLISREDQLFLRDKVEIENKLDEEGNEIKFSVTEKLLIATNADDVVAITKALLIAKDLAIK